MNSSLSLMLHPRCAEPARWSIPGHECFLWVILILCLPFALPVCAAPGDLPGNLDLDFAPVVDSEVNAIALQPDGSIVIGGWFTSHLARLNSKTGARDPNFVPDQTVGDTIFCTAVQEDRNIVVGGYFPHRIARLRPNGELDDGFHPEVVGQFVSCLAIQPDGKIVLGGEFTTGNEIPRVNIARLNSNGTLDEGFAVQGADGIVFSTAIQPDGKIVIAGSFSTINGTTRNGIARLNKNGDLDNDFNPNANGTVLCVAIQPDGILVGGAFSEIDGVPHRIARLRLNSEGSHDPDFHPDIGPAGLVYSLALQADGKILLAGTFDTVNGLPRENIARLHADGSLDLDFVANTDVRASGVAVQGDGRVIISGDFNIVNGTQRPRIARLLNDATTQDLSVCLGGIRWLRGGTSPEAQHVAFELSIDGGMNWTPLGAANRIQGGWELNGLNLPPSCRVRARARVNGGTYNGSSGIVEAVADPPAGPDIRLDQLPGGPVGNAGTVVFKNTAVGETTSLQLAIRNTGRANLAISGINVDGANSTEFRLEARAVDIAPCSEVSFYVTFAPCGLGQRTATLHIASNDPDGSPFDLTLSGTATAPVARWLPFIECDVRTDNQDFLTIFSDGSWTYTSDGGQRPYGLCDGDTVNGDAYTCMSPFGNPFPDPAALRNALRDWSAVVVSGTSPRCPAVGSGSNPGATVSVIEHTPKYVRVQFNDNGECGSQGRVNFRLRLSYRALIAPRTCDVACDGLVAYWPGDYHARDLVGANDGSLQNGTTYAVGVSGGAFQFDGADDSFRVPASPSLDVGASSGFTVAAWIRPHSLSGSQCLAEWGFGGIGAEFWINVALAGGGPGSLYANVVDASGANHIFSTAPGILGTDVFRHVALTYDRVSGGAALYADGLVIIQDKLGSFVPRTSEDLFIGRRSDGFGSYAGSMDEIVIFNRALSASEIQWIYLARGPSACWVSGTPPTITRQPQSQIIVSGATATLMVSAVGAMPLSYQWFTGQSGDVSNPIQGATDASFTTPPLAATALFWVEVSNARRNANSDTATITVPNSPEPLRLTWPQPASIVYGTALGDQQLNATANIPGSFIYTPGSGTVLPVGNHTQSVLFTPIDTVHYASASATVLLMVTPAALLVRAADVKSIVCAPLPAFQASYAGLLNSDTPASLALPLRLSTTASDCSPPGMYAIDCSGPANWRNYAVTYAPGTLRQLADTTSGLSLEPIDPSIEVGEVRLFKLTGTLSGGGRADLTKAAIWQSSNPAVLDTCGGGFVVGVEPGNAVLRAEYRGQSAALALEVQAVPGRQVFLNRTMLIDQTQLGRCRCLSGYRSTTEVIGLAGVVKGASAILFEQTGPASAYLDHLGERAFTSVTLLERDRLTDEPIYQWGFLSPPVCLALRDEAPQLLDRYFAPDSGIYQPDTSLGRQNMFAEARGPSPNGSWTLNGFLKAPYQIAGGWMLVIDSGDNEPPTILPVADRTVVASSRTVTIPLTVGDAETPVARMGVSMSFNNPRITSGYAYWGGRQANGQPVLSLRSDRFPVGPTRATVTVTDEAGAQTETSFNLTVTQNRTVGSFANSAPIQIPAYGKALLYPSSIEVSGMAGRIYKAEVTLHGLAHTWPDDLDVLLVAPDGRTVMLMSDAGGGKAVEALNIKFSASAADVPPDGGGYRLAVEPCRTAILAPNSQRPCAGSRGCICQVLPPSGLTSGTFRPVNYGSTDALPLPAPLGPYIANLENVTYGQPNGTWSLYVLDDTSRNQGLIAGGWSLDLVTSPEVQPLGQIAGVAAGVGLEPEPLPDQFLIKAWQSGDPLIRLDAVEDLPTGEALLRLTGRAGTLYTIESSTNGLTWEFAAQGVVEGEQFEYMAGNHVDSGRPAYRVSEGSRGGPAEPPRIVEFSHLPDGSSSLLIEATAGRAVIFQTSTNLQTWQDVQTFIHPGGTIQLFDPDDGERTRFYRLVLP